MRRIHHAGIVVKHLRDAYRFYRDTLGLPLVREAEIADQGVRAALLAAGETEIELLEPLHGTSGVGRFLAKRGEGLHHLCFETDVDRCLAGLRDRRVELLDSTPRPGLAGRVAFLHPRACAGVLVELATGDAPGAPASSLLDLRRLVIGARESRKTAELFQRLFALPEVAIDGGSRTMLGVGQGALLIVPAEEVDGIEGMAALSLVAEDLADLMARCDRANVKYLHGTGEVTIEPAAGHGVRLHISR